MTSNRNDHGGEAVLERLRSVIDKPTATAVATADPDQRLFIAEGLLIGAFVFVAEKYAEGFLEGAGLSDIAKKHGAAATEWLKRVHGGDAAVATEAVKRLEAVCDVVRAQRDGKQLARRGGERVVHESLRQLGVVDKRARAIAERVSGVIAGETGPSGRE